jgi:hypothetical protein
LKHRCHYVSLQDKITQCWQLQCTGLDILFFFPLFTHFNESTLELKNFPFLGVIIWLIILHRFSIAYTENWRWILPLYCNILITTNSKTIKVFWNFQHKKWFLFYSSLFYFFGFIIVYSSQSNNTITYLKTCLVYLKYPQHSPVCLNLL